ncbi:MAG: SHOCT domain-containing protein [Halarsenatibacteraceae bacterium]
MFGLWIILIIGAIWLFTDGFTGHRHSRGYHYCSDNKYMNGHSDHYENKESSEELARQRLAKGEISREEFEDIMVTLKRN